MTIRLRVASLWPTALVLVLAAACGGFPTEYVDVGLPDRTGDPDLSRVTAAFREQGGDAFIGLTGFPTPAAIAALSRAGLGPPVADTFAAIVTFPALGLKTAWGNIPPQGVDAIARLSFVVLIEPSADQASAR